MRLERRKQRKEKKRKQQDAKRKAYQDRLARERKNRDRYPAIVFDTTCGTPEFIDAVKHAVAQIDFDDETCVSEGDRYVYSLMAEYGASYALSCLKEAMNKREEAGDPYARFGELSFCCGLGEQIFLRIPEEQRRQLLPYNDLRVLFNDKRIVLSFSSLKSQLGLHGTIYFSRHMPKVEIEGEQKIVGFSRHAIERICERVNPRWLTYTAAGDVHAFFANCVYFEPVVLHGDQPAITFYDMCDMESFAQYGTYVRQVLGEENLDRSKGRAYYRVGYCPVVIEDGFAKAKTFLYPGYTATPEYGLLLNAHVRPADRAMLKELARQQDGTTVIVEDDPRAIKWFHDNGVPQVIQTKRTVFRYS